MNPEKKKIFWSVVLIVVLGFSVYGNSVNGQFVWDDEALIEDNRYIKSWAHLPEIFTENIGAGTDKESNYYRPLQMLTYMTDHSLWKLNVKGYHLSNILLHISVTLTLFWLIYILFQNWLVALLTGIFFIVHPIHTEVVTYISGRADSLALFFILLSFVFYIKNYHAEKTGTYILMLLSYALALLSRENSLILPVLMLLYHYSFKKELKGRSFFSIVGLSLIYILLRLTVLNAFIADADCDTTLLQRLPGFFAAITDYIRLLFLPFDLHMEYGNKLFQFTNFKVILGIIILLTLLIYAFRKKENNRIIFFSIAWFFIALLPASNLYPIKATMAEHWLYIPSIGFFLIAAKAISWLYGKKGFKTFTIVLIAGLMGFYSYVTVRQNVYWREPVVFYEQLSKFVTDSAKVYNNLGKSYYNAGKDNDKTISYYKKAVELDPEYYWAYFNLGLVYFRTNQFEDAIIAYKKVIEIRPDFARAHNNLGYSYYRSQKYPEAIPFYKKAIAIKPDYAEGYLNLGNAYNAMNNGREALSAYAKAVKIDPRYTEAYHNIGIVYFTMGENEKAVTFYKKALEMSPGDAETYYNLSVAYLALQQYPLAIENYDKASRLGYVDPELREHLRPYRR